MAEIKTQLRDYIAQNLLFSENGFPHDDEASFLEEGIVDSMEVMELVAFTEETFGIAIEDHEITPDNFDSINRLAGYISGKMTA